MPLSHHSIQLSRPTPCLPRLDSGVFAVDERGDNTAEVACVRLDAGQPTYAETDVEGAFLISVRRKSGVSHATVTCTEAE